MLTSFNIQNMMMMIHGATHGDMENELIQWLCQAQMNSTAMGGQMVNVRAEESALKMIADSKCSYGRQLQSKDMNTTWQSMNEEHASADAGKTQQWQEHVTHIHHYTK
jgi:mannitol-specific phosphotransferase system IIBC component